METTGKVDAQLGGKTFVICETFSLAEGRTPKQHQQAVHGATETVLVLRGVDFGEIASGSPVTVIVGKAGVAAFEAPQAPASHRGASDHLAPAPVVLDVPTIPEPEVLTAEEQAVVDEEAAAEKAHKAKKKGGK